MAATNPDGPPEGGPGDQPEHSRVGWWRRFRAWPRFARITAYAALAVVLVLLAGLLSVVHLVRAPFPQTSGEVDLPGSTAASRWSATTTASRSCTATP